MRKKLLKTKELFLEHKRKKKWVDNKDGSCGFMLYARSLFITWGQSWYWSWNSFKDTDDENIEVAKLISVCWLDVRGKLAMKELSPGVTYEVVYVVKLTKSASGWELPLMLRLHAPGDEIKVRQESLLMKPKGEWFELNLGSFQAKADISDEVCFDIFERGGHWKTGLIIKAAIIRPKH
ncbi:protein PHLOEM PROTEIN 2-LIKE A1-like [Chenopodium quinoa]|uniref:protein PHLOEM PROTEIN 2-LIKE A1-like n=1 Tax=Chenopodium quinoa TaxID=63459 RepID=UPI000B79483D|nr:protein PHLOEM PROTEIN 2-LIKE A1-like [Chenopodium quinoa]